MNLNNPQIGTTLDNLESEEQREKEHRYYEEQNIIRKNLNDSLNDSSLQKESQDIKAIGTAYSSKAGVNTLIDQMSEYAEGRESVRNAAMVLTLLSAGSVVSSAVQKDNYRSSHGIIDETKKEANQILNRMGFDEFKTEHNYSRNELWDSLKSVSYIGDVPELKSATDVNIVINGIELNENLSGALDNSEYLYKSADSSSAIPGSNLYSIDDMIKKGEAECRAKLADGSRISVVIPLKELGFGDDRSDKTTEYNPNVKFNIYDNNRSLDSILHSYTHKTKNANELSKQNYKIGMEALKSTGLDISGLSLRELHNILSEGKFKGMSLSHDQKILLEASINEKEKIRSETGIGKSTSKSLENAKARAKGMIVGACLDSDFSYGYNKIRKYVHTARTVTGNTIDLGMRAINKTISAPIKAVTAPIAVAGKIGAKVTKKSNNKLLDISNRSKNAVTSIIVVHM